MQIKYLFAFGGETLFYRIYLTPGSVFASRSAKNVFLTSPFAFPFISRSEPSYYILSLLPTFPSVHNILSIHGTVACNVNAGVFNEADWKMDEFASTVHCGYSLVTACALFYQSNAFRLKVYNLIKLR